ncbi:MAG: UDP-2,3-diacylglucosamine diphosphatase LpxI [Planctomycetota bacterium]
MSERPMGLIAGEGELPLLEARGLIAQGRRVVCVGLNGGGGGSDGTIAKELAEAYRSFPLLRLGAWARWLRKRGVEEAIMVGRVKKATMYDPGLILKGWPDWRVARLFLWKLRKDRRSQALLRGLADELMLCGVKLIDTTAYIPDHLADAGVMTKTPPSAGMQSDIDIAWPVLMQLNALDVGQAVAVRGKDIVAVEAIEGTDGLIERAGVLSRGKGWTLCKGGGPGKDLRFDVPTVGVQTIEKLAAAGAVCLALEAGRVILVDKPAVLKAADDAGIAVVGVTGDDDA